MEGPIEEQFSVVLSVMWISSEFNGKDDCNFGCPCDAYNGGQK